MKVRDSQQPRPEPWAMVKLRIEFPADPDTYVFAQALYDGDDFAATVNEMRDRALTNFARDIGYYAAKKQAAA